MSLREIFLSKILDKFFIALRMGPLRDWKPETVYELVKSTMQEKATEIGYYIGSHNVSLLTMDEHADTIVKEILLPYISKKRVE